MKKHFLGWHAPFITLAVDWLWEKKESFSEILLVVPTMESGRKIRQTLAERGACFAPEVCTAGKFGTMGYEGEESLLLEQIIWEETLRNFDWTQCQGVFPKPQAENWERNLSEELRRLRIQTGEYGMTFHTVSQRLPDDHPDSGRWKLLANWEATYFKNMKRLGADDSFQVRNADYGKARLPSGIKSVVLVGVTDPTEQAVRMAHACSENDYQVDTLISAPEAMEDSFDAVGRPVAEYWTTEKIHWVDRNASILAAADARSLAPCLLQSLTETLTTEGENLSLGIGNKEVTPLLKSAFKDAGYTLFDPAGAPITDWSFVEWYRVWVRFAKQEKIEDLRVLIRSPWTARLMERFTKDFYWISKALEEVSQSAKPVNITDLWHIKKSEWPFDSRDVEQRRKHLDDVLDVVQGIREWRGLFKKAVSIKALRAFLETTLQGEESEEALIAETVFSALEEEAARLPKKHAEAFDFAQEFLKRLEQERIGDKRENVHIEALGWLELAFESSPNLFITGLNEGVLPNTEIGDTWLPESLREFLGMRTNRERFAHDVFYLKSLLEARKESGKVVSFFLKTGLQGDPLKPSRLLLQVPTEELPERVMHCFSGHFFSIPALPWERDWKLTAPQSPAISKLSPSSIKDYLQCPFRFYLKHVLRMQKPPETLQEWNHGEFGTIIHAVLENMQGNADVLAEINPRILEKWFHDELDAIVEKQFSTHLTLAFQIQRESLKQRLSFFAEVETTDRLENAGWTPVSFEEAFSFEIEGIKVRGIIDRVDKHVDGRYRVVDYKTGKERSAQQAHLSKITAATKLPPHLEETEVIFTREGKPHLWTNLQLPIYALYCAEKYGVCPTLRFGLIGQTMADTRYSDWEFTSEEMDVAKRALEAVVHKVNAGIFFPPVERPRSGYDDYSDLSYGYPLAEGVEQGEYLLNKPAAITELQTQGD